MCEKLLANTVVEDYAVEIVESSRWSSRSPRAPPMKCGVVVFPGSNCDHDVYHVLKHVLGQDAAFLWHQDDTVSRAATWWSSPAASPTATTCGPARSPRSRR